MDQISIILLYVYQTSQLYEDQLLFESSNFDNRHSELLQNGSLLCQKLKEFEGLGNSCFENLPVDLVRKLSETVKDYQALLLPPKILGCCVSCIKSKRTGLEYEKKLLDVHIRVIGAIFILQISMISFTSELINEDGKRFSSYGIRMNALANTLEGINVRTNENAKEDLRVTLEAVEEFVKDFFSAEMKNSFNEALKRIKLTREILSPENGGNSNSGHKVTKRMIVNAQANLQEIMNSAADVSAMKCKEKMDDLERQSAALREATKLLLNGYRSLEEPVSAAQLEEVLERHKEFTEELEKALDNKLKLLKKQWKTIRGQSTLRPIAIYEETDGGSLSSLNPVTTVGAVGAGIGMGVGAAAAGVGAAAVGAGNWAGKVGHMTAAIPYKAATIAANVPTKVVTAAIQLPKGAANKIFGKDTVQEQK